jgi:transcriptional regulator with XRE-family HTH domain
VTVRQLIREVLSAGWTQVQLAEELTRRGYPTAQPTISRWLSGRRPMRRATEIVLRAMLEAILCSEPVTLATPCVASHRTLAGSEERMALRVDAPTRCNAGHGAAGLSTGGSGNCPEIPDGSRS